MLIRTLLSSTLIVCSISCWSQNYFLPTPKDWQTETFSFPIEFAPKIPFTGSEELRFTPGWGNTLSDEHWSYCFLWWIKADSKIDAVNLKAYLEQYYSGLVNRNIIKRNIDSSKVVPTVAQVKVSNDNKSYTATVSMLNYMNQQPVTLNITIQIKDCADAGMKAIFISVSPQSGTHFVWKKFNEIWKGFTCKK